MRMAPHQLGGNGVEGIRHFETSGFSRDLGMEDTLEHHIAEFARERVQVAPVQDLERLVGFLQQKGAQAGVRLLAIPRTPALGAQRGHDAHKPRHGSTRACRAG